MYTPILPRRLSNIVVQGPMSIIAGRGVDAKTCLTHNGLQIYAASICSAALSAVQSCHMMTFHWTSAQLIMNMLLNAITHAKGKPIGWQYEAGTTQGQEGKSSLPQSSFNPSYDHFLESC